MSITKRGIRTYVCGNYPPVPGSFLPACAALWLASFPLSLPLQPFSHSGGGAVLPEKVRTQISRHFLYTAHTHALVLPSRALRELGHLTLRKKKKKSIRALHRSFDFMCFIPDSCTVLFYLILLYLF